VDYETEEQQVEALKEWWAENGRAVMLGIVLGIAIIGAWMWWQSHQENKAIAASDNFYQSIEALQAGDFAKVSELAGAAQDDHDGSLYAAYTSMAAAHAAIEEGDLEAASTHLQWAVDNATLDDVSTIASVRLARVKAALGDATGGLSVLPGSYNDAFKALVEEARGDLHVVAGDPQAARAAYQIALDAEGVPDINALRMKFNELAAVGG
jgi:predicted negative regulator of RcsB-dependent stress response